MLIALDVDLGSLGHLDGDLDRGRRLLVGARAGLSAEARPMVL
jgi:hypothetical protein